MFDTIIEEHGVYKVNSYVEIGTVVNQRRALEASPALNSCPGSRIRMWIYKNFHDFDNKK
jgi:hypothetical protein